MSEEFGNDYVVLTDEEGNEREFEHIDTVGMDGETYMAFIPADLKVEEEAEVVILKVVEEGGEEILESVQRILSAGIPVMAHLGLTPQSIHKFGTYTVRAKEEAEAEKLVRDAHLLSDAGCFACVLEKIPAALAARVSREIQIPTIGIGAGGACDGQVLVIHDMLGINKDFSPRFLRRYADLHTVMTDAVTGYIRDVKEGDFPNEKEQY